MRRYALRASWSSSACGGLTLVELLVTLVILSILAAAALPYAEMSVRRNQEIDLRRALRDIRTAIDHLHEDWKTGKVSKLSNDISEDGYPKTLQVLTEGVESAQAKGGKVKYLRRVPKDPFVGGDKPAEEQWVVRGYQDEPDSITWNGRDVYDVHSSSERVALDGSRYREW